MSRSRLTYQRAFISGAHLRNPGRFAGSQPPPETGPLGSPYPGMNRAQIAVWKHCEAEMPWLQRHHRLIVRLACIVAVRTFESGAGIGLHRLLSSSLAKLGATPAR